MTWNYQHFSFEEMTCKCGCGGLPKPEFMEILETIRAEINIPMIVSSGFRCPEYNKNHSSTGLNGPHTFGLAADVKGYGTFALKLVQVALKHGITGIGVSQKGDHKSRYIHLDCLPLGDHIHPRPFIWSY